MFHLKQVGIYRRCHSWDVRHHLEFTWVFEINYRCSVWRVDPHHNLHQNEYVSLSKLGQSALTLNWPRKAGGVIMHQDSIMNEQNLSNSFEGNLGNFSRWTLCVKNRSWRSKDQAKILREILEIIQIEDYAPRIDNEWLKLRQKIWGKIWKVF